MRPRFSGLKNQANPKIIKITVQTITGVSNTKRRNASWNFQDRKNQANPKILKIIIQTIAGVSNMKRRNASENFCIFAKSQQL